MGSATRPPERRASLRAALGRLGAALRASVRAPLGTIARHLLRIRYRLLLINIVVVAVPLIGISFARTFEREMLRGLEDDMIHQAQLVREMLHADPAGLRLDQRGPMLAAAARHTRTRIRLLDHAGRVVADSHRHGPPEGAEPRTPSLLGYREGSYHEPETPKPMDVSGRREVAEALQGRYGAATRLWESQDRVYLFSALPIMASSDPATAPASSSASASAPGSASESASGSESVSDSESVSASAVAGIVYVTRSTVPVKLAMFRLRTWLFWVLVASLAVTAVLSLFLAATIARPLGRLTRRAERIAAGERDLRLSLARGDEIGQLARAFDTMTRRLDERLQHTRALAADISHEFKSPLTSIRGAAELLRDGAADDPPARERFLGNIIEDTERLDRLVTRLLELSRVEAETTPAALFDYEALTREVVDQRRELAHPIHIRLAYRSRTTQVRGRRSHLAAVLGNLLDNAIQHAAPGTAIELRVSDLPGDRIRTTVTNRGPVLSEAVMARMWDRFFTTRAKQGGTGLGLAIVASVVRAHGGTVSATSTAADGTAFTIELPRHP